MARIEVIAALLATWTVFRLLAGRATLATRDFALVFVVGAVGSTAVAVVVERLIRSGTTYSRLSHVYAGPVEELAKALPLAVLVVAYAGWRRLSLADWSLLGLAGALGFTTVQWALEATMPEGDPGAPLVWQHWLLGSRDESVYGNTVVVGAASTALVGLVAGLGIRFARSRWGGVAGLLALAAAALDAGAYRDAVGPLASGNNSRFAHVGGALGTLHAILLHGRLELYALVAGLVLAGWIEGRWVLHTNPHPRRVLLPEEATVPLVVVEWIAAVTRVRRGWTAFARANAYFRARREYGLLLAQLRSDRSAAGLRDEAMQARDRVVAARRALDDAPAAPLAVGGWLGTHATAVAGAVVLLLIWLVAPTNALVGSGGVAVGLLVLGLALAVLRLGDRRAGQLERLTTLTALGVGVLALIGLFLSLPTVLPDYDSETIAFAPIDRWLAGHGYPAYGGNPHVLFAAAVFACACASATFRPVPRRRAADAPETAPTVAGGGA